MTTIESISLLAKIYAEHRGVALSTLGRLGMGTGRFFERARDGRITIRRAERAIQWFSDHWPSDLEWPSDIPRPPPSEPGRDEAA